MTKTQEALVSQSNLFGQLFGLIRDLIRNVNAQQADKDELLSQLAVLTGADEAAALEILSKNPEIQAAIDEAAAAIPAATPSEPIAAL